MGSIGCQARHRTDSTFGQHEGKLSSPELSDMSGLSVTAPALTEHSTGSLAEPMPAHAQQPLYKEPSFAVTDTPDMYHSPLPSEAAKACEAGAVAHAGPCQQIAVPAATQAQAIAIPVQGGRDLSQSRRSSHEQPSSWTRAGMPAPASPFATAEDDDFTFSGSRATEGDHPARSELPGSSSASTQPGTSPGQESLFALRQQESSASQQGQRLADSAPARARRSLESADSAYTAMHAERQHQVEQLALRGGASAAARPEAASVTGRSAMHDHSQHQASCDDRSDLTPGYSQASSMALSPVVGRPVRCATSLFHAALKVMMNTGAQDVCNH